MEVVDYENTTEISLNIADSNNAWEWSVSNIPWVNSPKIDANTSVSNLPVVPPDVLGIGASWQTLTCIVASWERLDCPL